MAPLRAALAYICYATLAELLPLRCHCYAITLWFGEPAGCCRPTYATALPAKVIHRLHYMRHTYADMNAASHTYHCCLITSYAAPRYAFIIYVTPWCYRASATLAIYAAITDIIRHATTLITAIITHIHIRWRLHYVMPYATLLLRHASHLIFSLLPHTRAIRGACGVAVVRARYISH